MEEKSAGAFNDALLQRVAGLMFCVCFLVFLCFIIDALYLLRLHWRPNLSPPLHGLTLSLCALVVLRNLSLKPDNTVYVLQELRVERTSQKHIVLGKLQYIRKDAEWELRKLFGMRVNLRISVVERRKKG